MKMSIKLEKNNFSFSGIAKEFEVLVEEEIFKATEKTADMARTRVPVDTGTLANSIITKHTKFEGKIIAAAHYAPYVEFGTGGFVNVPPNLSSYAMKFKGKGIKQVNLPPRPYLYPSWRFETNEMLRRLKKEIE